MATYHVSKHASASDSNGGTNQTTDALATMAGAFALWSSGDAIVVGAGVYTWKNTAIPSTWFPNGASGDPTTVATYGDGPVTFHWDRTGQAGYVYFTGLTRNYVSFLGSSGSEMIFDMQAYVDLCASDGKWTASGSGTNEYYYTTSADGDPVLAHPQFVHIGARATAKGTYATEGTPGSLAAGRWGYGDNDSLGFNTVYVRLNDGTDPDTKADGSAAVYDSYIYSHNGIHPTTFNSGWSGFYLGNTPNGNFTFEHVRVTRTYGSGVLGGSAHDVSATNCRFDHCGWKLWDATIGFLWHDYGVYASGANLSFIDCEMDNNSGYGLHFYPTVSSGLLVDGGSYHDNGKQNGVSTTETKPGILVYNAVSPTLQNAYVYANVGGGVLLHNCQDPSVLHNTIVDTEAHATSGGEIGLEIRNTSLRPIVKNNLIGGNADGSIVVRSGCNNGVLTWNRLDSAISDSSTGATKTDNTSTGWNASTLFTNAASQDYTLKSGSAAIGAATTNEVPSVGVTRDNKNAARPQGAFYDQGADEFASDPPDGPANSHPATQTVTTTAYTTITDVTVAPGTNDVVSVQLSGSKVSFQVTPSGSATVVKGS